MRQKRVFTPAEQILINAYLEAGKGVKYIAKELHCDNQIVSAFIKETRGEGAVPKAGRKADPNKPKRVKVTVDRKPIQLNDPNDTFEDIPEDITANTKEANDAFVKDMLEFMSMGIVPCQTIMRHLKGMEDGIQTNVKVGHATVDIYLPGEKTIIINVSDNEERNKWYKKVGVDGFRLTEYFRANHIAFTILVSEGIHKVIAELNDHATWRDTHRVP